MDAPPIVCKDVENAQHDNEERCRPFCLEPDSNHNASSQPNNRQQDTAYAPAPLKNEPNEQEDKKYASRKQEAILGRRD